MKADKPVLGYIFSFISGSIGQIVFRNNRVHQWVHPHQPCEFYENQFKTANLYRAVIFTLLNIA